MQKRSLSGVLFCLFTVLAYGIQFPIVDNAFHYIDPFFLSAIRYGFTALLFAILLWIFEGRQAFHIKNEFWKLSMLGSFGFAGFSFLVFGGQKLLGNRGAETASVIMALMPLITLIVNWGYQKITPSLFSLYMMLLAFVGVVLVVTKGDFTSLSSLKESIPGDVLILLGAVSWVIYTIGGAKYQHYSVLRYSALTTCLGEVTILLITLFVSITGIVRIPTFHILMSISWDILYMIIIAGIGALFCWNLGNKRLGSTNSVLFMNLIPVTTLSLEIFEGHTFTLPEIVGILLVIFSLVFNNLYLKKRTIVRSRSQILSE